MHANNIDKAKSACGNNGLNKKYQNIFNNNKQRYRSKCNPNHYFFTSYEIKGNAQINESNKIDSTFEIVGTYDIQSLSVYFSMPFTYDEDQRQLILRSISTSFRHSNGKTRQQTQFFSRSKYTSEKILELDSHSKLQFQ